MIKFKDKQTMIRLLGVLIVALLAGYAFFSAVKGILNPSKEAAQSSLQSSKQQSNISTTPVASTETTEEKQAFASYVVQKGDTLYSIAKDYSEDCPQNIVVKTITFWNNISDPATIDIGANLVIPVNYLNSGSIHTVKKGDTLYSIAKTYLGDIDTKAAVEKIKNDNFLTSSDIAVGDELFITDKTLN